MIKRMSIFFAIIILTIFTTVPLSEEVSAASYADGTYNLPFEMKEAGSDSTSIADGYFEKPGKLKVEDGKLFVQLTTNESDWVKSITGPKGKASTISENGNNRTVQFEVEDISTPVDVKMHVVVPEDVAGMEYDHNHSVRIAFDDSDVATGSNANNNESSDDTSSTNANEENDEQTGSVVESGEDNPKTGDTSPIGVYVFLLLASILAIIVYETRYARSE